MTIKKLSKRGRPELSEGQKKSVITQFRCTAEEKARFEQAALMAGKSLSDWLRERAVRGL
jgi:hypothetical protein